MHRAELRPGAELSRPQQRDEVVQLAQVVLQRRRREQQDEVAFDFLNELVGRAALALDLVRLVHDHEVPAVPQDLLGMPARARAVVRHDRLGDVQPVAGLARRVEALEELLLELALPLPHERGRRQDQHAAGEPANRELLVDDARLDRLAEAHLVGQDGAAAHVAQHPLGDVDLVRQRLDRVRVECDQPFEARDQGDPFRLTPQFVPGAVGRGRLEPFRERLEGVLVYRPDVLGWRSGQGQNGWRLRHRHAAGGEGATIYQLSVISQNPYSSAGLSTRILRRTASSGAHSSKRSSRFASSGKASFAAVGCGQLLAQSMRSGAALTSAFARIPMSSYRGGPLFDTSYAAESFTQQRPESTSLSSDLNAGCCGGTGSRNFPTWSMMKRPGRRRICASRSGSVRPSSCTTACQPNACTRAASPSITSQPSAPPGSVMKRIPRMPPRVSASSCGSVTDGFTTPTPFASGPRCAIASSVQRLSSW